MDEESWGEAGVEGRFEGEGVEGRETKDGFWWCFGRQIKVVVTAPASCLIDGQCLEAKFNIWVGLWVESFIFE